MNGFLLDTNFISEFVKPKPDLIALSRIKRIESALLFVSVMSFGELRLGIERLPEGMRRRGLEQWLANGLPPWFTTNLIPIDKPVVEIWAKLTAQASKKGITLSIADGLIAATALHHGLTLVTRNVKDFSNLGLDILNPWEPHQ